MQDEKDLGSVPDASMLALFQGLVDFLKSEAEGRGWEDIKKSLGQVQTVLADRGKVRVSER